MISENEDECLVKIGDVEISGWIIKQQMCKFCGEHPVYYEKYDAIFCPTENKWLETACSDNICEYCKDRPVRPI